MERTGKLFCFVFKLCIAHLLILDTQDSFCSVWTTYFAGHKALYMNFIIKLNDLWRSSNLLTQPSLISRLKTAAASILIRIFSLFFFFYFLNSNNKKVYYIQLKNEECGQRMFSLISLQWVCKGIFLGDKNKKKKDEYNKEYFPYGPLS